MEFYVYIHRKKTTGEVFYVGKGKGKRAWDFVKRSDFWKRVKDKHGVTVEIYQNNLQEWYAFELEKELIALYGRVTDGKGSLVNLTDGGESASGLDCPRSDKNIYNFYNFRTKETFIGTRVAFKGKYKIDPASLFHDLSSRVDKNIKGWLLYEDEIPSKVRIGFSGNLGTNVDQTEYNFVNIVTDETFRGTRVDFREKYSISTTNMFSKGYGENNWYCIEKTTAENLNYAVNGNRPNPNMDNNVYKFEHKDGDVFEGKRVDFTDKTGLNPSILFCTNPCLSIEGWFLQEKKEEFFRVRNDWDEYEFFNLETKVSIVTTRRKFLTAYPDVPIHHIFNKVCSKAKDWTIPAIVGEGEMRKLQEGRTGNNHHLSDKTVYDFVNSKTGEVFNGTRSDLKKKVGKSIDDLFRKSRPPKSVHGWFFAPS